MSSSCAKSATAPHVVWPSRADDLDRISTILKQESSVKGVPATQERRGLGSAAGSVAVGTGKPCEGWLATEQGRRSAASTAATSAGGRLVKRAGTAGEFRVGNAPDDRCGDKEEVLAAAAT